MQREITMEAVFRAGFDAGFEDYDEYADPTIKAEYTGKFHKLRQDAWLEYVKELESNAPAKV